MSGGYFQSPSGRSAARATVGGEFPTGTLSVVPRVPSSPLVHVSVSPPLIPDSRLSRVRLAASDVLSYYNTAFPCAWRLKRTLAYTPHTPGLLCRLPVDPLTIVSEPRVSYGATCLAITVPRAPSPHWGVTPPRGVFPHPRPALPSPHCYYGLMRQTSPLSPPTHEGLVGESVQVAACPC